MIVGNYVEEVGGWCPRGVREAYGVDLWKAIRNGWEVVSNRMGFKVGNGQRVKFWNDR